MTPEQAESIAQHREKMAQINMSALAAVNNLAAINSQAILHHSVMVADRKQKAIDEVVEHMKGMIRGQGGDGEVEGAV